MKSVTVLLCAALFFFTACADIPGTSIVSQGEPCPLRIKFVEGGPFTKADTPISESIIEDINIFIFTPDNLLIRRSYIMGSNVSLEDMLLTTNASYNIYAVANWGKEIECNNALELESMMYVGDDLAALQNGKGAKILSGKLKNVKLSFKEPLVMELGRLLGKVHVRCNMSGLSSGVTLSVKKVSLKNVPQEVALFKDNVAVEVVDGGCMEGGILNGITYNGVDFYMFENLQGDVEGATGNKDKANLLGQARRSVCSYIEMECSLVSKSKRGTITYRFYLGGNTDCNVYRNACQNITVNFVGNVSEEENSVSVDNGALLDRVVELRVYPALIAFAQGTLGATYQCRVEVFPETAYDKSVVWSSTNSKVASVNKTGLITTRSVGKCNIWVTSVENPSIDERVIVQVH